MQDVQQLLDSKFQTNDIIELNTCLTVDSPYYYGYNIEAHFLEELKKLDSDKIFFITEENIDTLYAKSFFEKIKTHYPNSEKLFVPSGDASKNFTLLETICEELIDRGVSKKSILIAFGGGAVGNIVGLASGLIYRGIRYIEIPTTTTGVTDSTLSNKQAINGAKGKNHFGIYYAPLFIWGDVKYLETEPLRSRQSGLVEAIKNGFISNPEFLTYVRNFFSSKGPMDLTSKELFIICYKIIQSKLEILKKDPTEKRYGIILEYGHTFGHAIEWLAKGKLIHGEAVAIGMCIAAELAFQLNFITKDIVDLHYDCMSKLQLSTALPDYVNLKNLLQIMKSDNKKTGEAIKYTLLGKMGACLNTHGDYLEIVETSVVEDVLRTYYHRKEDNSIITDSAPVAS